MAQDAKIAVARMRMKDQPILYAEQVSSNSMPLTCGCSYALSRSHFCVCESTQDFFKHKSASEADMYLPILISREQSSMSLSLSQCFFLTSP